MDVKAKFLFASTFFLWFFYAFGSIPSGECFFLGRSFYHTGCLVFAFFMSSIPFFALYFHWELKRIGLSYLLLASYFLVSALAFIGAVWWIVALSILCFLVSIIGLLVEEIQEPEWSVRFRR